MEPLPLTEAFKECTRLNLSTLSVTFPDLRSGCDYYALCKHLPASPREKGPPVSQKPSSLRLPSLHFDGTSHLHCSFSSGSYLPAALAAFLSDPDAVKASVPKLFICPGAPASPSRARGLVVSRRPQKPTTSAALAPSVVGPRCLAPPQAEPAHASATTVPVRDRLVPLPCTTVATSL